MKIPALKGLRTNLNISRRLGKGEVMFRQGNTILLEKLRRGRIKKINTIGKIMYAVKEKK